MPHRVNVPTPACGIGRAITVLFGRIWHSHAPRVVNWPGGFNLSYEFTQHTSSIFFPTGRLQTVLVKLTVCTNARELGPSATSRAEEVVVSVTK